MTNGGEKAWKMNGGDIWSKVFDAGFKVTMFLLTALIGILIYEGRQILDKIEDHEKRTTKIESSYYSNTEAMKDQRAVSLDIIQLRERINNNFGFDRLSEDIKEIKSTIREIREARAKSSN